MSAASPLPGLHPLVGQILARRGLTSPEAARAFLDPSAYAPSPPDELPGLAEAVERVERAVRKQESICVWGDFDVDGQTATTILYATLLSLGGNVIYHIPVRASESHGISTPHLEAILERGVHLILTCDTGVTAHEAVELANARGIDVVISDHHELPPELPHALAVLNPKQLPEGHPLSSLSGAGVAYKLAEALYVRFDMAAAAESHLDLAALGVVADLAVLRGDARYLVQRGLGTLRATGRLGLQVMMELADLSPGSLNEEHIGFVLAPRLNALGRLGDANPAVELLTTANPARARVLATQLENYNAQRRLICNQVIQAAEAQLQRNPALMTDAAIVLVHHAWPAGVIGIVASHLVERYHRPAILIASPAGEPARGSARSVEGLNISAAIAAHQDMLLNFGGHPMAAGLVLDVEKIPEFRKAITTTIAKMMGDAQVEPTLQIDRWISLTEVTSDLAAAIEQLAPFGPGNPKPILAGRQLTITSSVPLGKNREHRRLNVEDEHGSRGQVIWWDGGEEEIPKGRVDLAFTVRASDWRGAPQVQLEFVDIRSVEEKAAEVKNTAVKVVDYRQTKNPQEVFRLLPAETLIWVEGENPSNVRGLDRNALTRAPALAIWTIPPSREDLRHALEIVQPTTVYLIAASPDIESTDAFMGKLAGLIKYAIQQREGRIRYGELAAATMERAITVRKGIAWLVSRGTIQIMREDREGLQVGVGTSIKDPAGAAQLWVEIQVLLAEAASYRSYFRRAETKSLIE